MPTYYTQLLLEEKEANLAEYAMLCARNFGALFFMRDAPKNSIIPEKIQASPYHFNETYKYKKLLDEFESLSREDKIKILKEESVQRIKSYEEYESKRNLAVIRMETMLEKVNLWMPPSFQHTNLKDFMIAQIEDTLKNEGDGEYYKNKIKIEMDQFNHGGTVDLLIESKINELKSNIEYHMNQYSRAVADAEASDLWIRQLRISLGLGHLTSHDSMDNSHHLGGNP